MRDIVQYTREHWGSAQVRHYIGKLERGIARLAAGQGPFRDMSELFPALQMAHCERHHVFYLPRESEPGLVVAVFHERMDLTTRLAERLKGDSQAIGRQERSDEVAFAETCSPATAR